MDQVQPIANARDKSALQIINEDTSFRVKPKAAEGAGDAGVVTPPPLEKVVEGPGAKYAVQEDGGEGSGGGGEGSTSSQEAGWGRDKVSPEGWGAAVAAGLNGRAAKSFNRNLGILGGQGSMGPRTLSGEERSALFEQQKTLMDTKGGVLDPSNAFFRYWDLNMTVLMLFTCLVTPFEVAFLETELGTLFFLNRYVDFFFLLDMFLNFVMPYQDRNGIWVTHQAKILLRYLRTWFLVDFISIFPFDTISYISSNDSASNLQVLRVLRLLRLIKLLRVMRVGRVFRRWESAIAIDYMMVELTKFVLIVLAIAHWLACAWHLVRRLEENEEPIGGEDGPRNWVEHYSFLEEESSHWSKYLAALYWSIATLSTLGYGDIIPTTDSERAFVVVSAIIGSSIYAYMVGNVCGLLAGMDVRNAKYYETMRNLNLFMNEKRLPQWLRVRLRDFFRFRRKNSNISDWQGLLTEMSPALRASVSGFVHRKWVLTVRPFQGFSATCVAAIAMQLDSQAFAACELVFKANQVADHFYIVERGVLMVNERVVVMGGYFGMEMMLRKNEILKRTYSSITLTHAVLLKISHGVLTEVLDAFPAESRRLRSWVLRMVFKDGIMAYVRALKKIARDDFVFTRDWESGFSSNVLPLVYKHKYGRQNRSFENMAKYVHAVSKLQQAMKRFVVRKAKEREAEGERRKAAAWPMVQNLLSGLGMSEYEDALKAEEVTIDTLLRVSAGDIRQLGVPLGKADRLIAAALQSHSGRKTKELRTSTSTGKALQYAENAAATAEDGGGDDDSSGGLRSGSFRRTVSLPGGPRASFESSSSRRDSIGRGVDHMKARMKGILDGRPGGGGSVSPSPSTPTSSAGAFSPASGRMSQD